MKIITADLTITVSESVSQHFELENVFSFESQRDRRLINEPVPPIHLFIPQRTTTGVSAPRSTQHSRITKVSSMGGSDANPWEAVMQTLST